MQISNVKAPAAARVEDVAGHRMQHGSEYLRHMLQRMRFLYRGALPPLLTNGNVSTRLSLSLFLLSLSRLPALSLSLCMHAQMPNTDSGTQITCCTITKVQILTRQEVL